MYVLPNYITYEVILEKTKKAKKSKSNQDSRISIQFKENIGYIAIY